MAKRTGRYQPDPGPPDVPPGVQPEEDGLLQCLDCGRWFRQLGQHVAVKHDSVEEYRRGHELPASRGLHAADIIAKRRSDGRQRWADDPMLRERLVPQTPRAELVEMSRAARTESAARAGTRATSAQNGRRAHEAWIASIDARYLPAVRDLGFAAIGEFLDAHTGVNDPGLARLLDCTTKQAANLRRRYGREPVGRWADEYRVKHPNMQPPLPRDDLAAIPEGVQPQRPTGELLCLECGRFTWSVAKHLGNAHGIKEADYRRRHRLRTEVVLHRSAERTADLAAREQTWGAARLTGAGPEHATAFRNHYGHLAVTALYVCDDGHRLGAFLVGKRASHRKGGMGPDETAAWEAAGIVWEPRWQRRDRRGPLAAEGFFLDHGHLNATTDYTTADGYALGRWIDRQRMARGESLLALWEIAEFDELGMVWETPQRSDAFRRTAW